MNEIELKLQVPPAQRRAVDLAVSGRHPRPRMRLQAAYQDTASRALAAAGMALRLRREGRQWVQTLKGPGEDGLTRFEHNVLRGAAAATPAIDPTLHAGTPVGDRLMAVLAAVPDAPLLTLYRTDIMRRTRELVVRTPGRTGAKVELAFDAGHIHAGEAASEVCELEIELLAGGALAVIDTARRWLPRHGLWLDGRSKAERGDLLARGETVAPARMARVVRLAVGVEPEGAWQAVLRNCAEQVLGNASQVASGEHGPEHVHQLRVGLRRLRSAIALFDDAGVALADGAAALFRGLGAARDQVVVEGEFGPELSAAMSVAGLPVPAVSGPQAPVLSHLLLREAASQHFLLDLLAAMHAGPLDPGPVPVRHRLAARLDHWHRQVVHDAKRYAGLDDERRHRLRKRAKRLRYAVEFSAGLFGRKAVSRYLKALRALQDRLGKVSDVVTAIAFYRARAAADPQAMFALGWLVARREKLLNEAVPALKTFGKVERFWKGD